MEEDLRTKAAPPRTFTNPDNMVEMIRRGNGFRDLASKQAFSDEVLRWLLHGNSLSPFRKTCSSHLSELAEERHCR
jgi:hypothetical protein